MHRYHFWFNISGVVSLVMLLSSCASKDVSEQIETAQSEPHQSINETLDKRFNEDYVERTRSHANPLKNINKRETILNGYVADAANESVLLHTMEDSNALISVDFVDVNIKIAIELLLNMRGHSVSFHTSVNDGTLKVKFINQSWQHIFQSILTMNDLALAPSLNPNYVTVHTNQSLEELLNAKRAQLVRKLKNQANYHKITNTQSALGEVNKLDRFDIFHTDLTKLSEQLKVVFGSHYLTDNQPIIVADVFSNALLIRGAQSQLDLAERLIDALDKKQPQVFIEIIMVSVGDDFDFQLGSQLSLQDSSSQLIESDLTTEAVVSFSLLQDLAIGELKLALDVLEQKDFSKTLSNPKVLVKNNTLAKFVQGTQFQITTSTTDSNGNITESIEYKDANLQLEVTPKISKNGQILMALIVKNDELQIDGETINRMEVNTEFLVESNQVISIGGLFVSQLTQTQQKVPVLGDIPVLGNLFRSDVQSDDTSELLIFIAPKVI